MIACSASVYLNQIPRDRWNRNVTEETPHAGLRIKDLPRDNQRQNKMVKDAAREAGLNNEQRRKLGKSIEYDTRHEGIDHDYHTILERAKEVARAGNDE